MSIANSIEIPIECPKCGHVIKKRLSELQTKHTLTCRCGLGIAIDPAGFKSVAKSITDFQKSIAKLRK